MLVPDETRFLQVLFLGGSNCQMINPLEKIRARFIRHAVRELPREGILFQENLDLAAQQGFGFIGQRPVKILAGRRGSVCDPLVTVQLGGVVCSNHTHHLSNSTGESSRIKSLIDSNG